MCSGAGGGSERVAGAPGGGNCVCKHENLRTPSEQTNLATEHHRVQIKLIAVKGISTSVKSHRVERRTAGGFGAFVWGNAAQPET